ncbi:MAG: GNAT family N-acetyltransferase [Lachnospiraceae bacterium]|nr:GNAT family N-acetyltransferase [Lachnospiraceae bacterium]
MKKHAVQSYFPTKPALILRCLAEGLYPSWDAQNRISVHLAEKLGYEFDHEYTAYEMKG